MVATNGMQVVELAADGTVVTDVWIPEEWLIEAIAVSPDGCLLAATYCPRGEASQHRSQGVIVWKWPGGNVLARLSGQASNLSFHPSDGTLAVSLFRKTVIWDPAEDRIVRELQGHRGVVQDVEHRPDGSRIATAGWDGDVHLWEARSGDHLQHLTGPRLAHRVRFHPTRPWLAVSEPGATHIWTLDTDELTTIARSRVTRHLSTEERRRFLPQHNPTA